MKVPHLKFKDNCNIDNSKRYVLAGKKPSAVRPSWKIWNLLSWAHTTIVATIRHRPKANKWSPKYYY